LLLVGLLPWSTFVPSALRSAWRGGVNHAEREASWFVLLWFAVIFVFFSIPASKPAGYILPAVAPLAILIGVSLARLVEQNRSRDQWGQKLRDPFFLFALTTTLTAIGLMLYAHMWFAAQETARVAYWLVTLVTIAWISAAIATLWLHSIGRRLLAIGVIAGASAVVCAMIITMLPMRDGRSQERVGIALETALQQERLPVVFFRNFFYAVPMYANLTEPVLLVDQWDDPESTRDDNWRLTLWRGSSWQPQTRRLFVTPNNLAQQLLRAGGGYILSEPGTISEVEAIIAAEPKLEQRTLYQDDIYELIRAKIR
jgi:4-amino-4-deoxy-L-arabinose transferase-like glycosyltransferase